MPLLFGRSNDEATFFAGNIDDQSGAKAGFLQPLATKSQVGKVPVMPAGPAKTFIADGELPFFNGRDGGFARGCHTYYFLMQSKLRPGCISHSAAGYYPFFTGYLQDNAYLSLHQKGYFCPY